VPLGLHVGKGLGVGEDGLAVGGVVAVGRTVEVFSPPHPAPMIITIDAATNVPSFNRAATSGLASLLQVFLIGTEG
jgi:hypothetical protein